MQSTEGNGHSSVKKPVSEAMRLLDPSKIEISRDAFDHVRLVIEGDEEHENVRVARAFPVSKPNQYLSFLNSDGKEIGMIEEMKRLDASSRRVLEEELDRAYFTPIIQQVYSVDSNHGATTWKVKTDRGETTIFAKDRSDIRRLPGRRILFTDVHGMKYDVPDYTQLDERSRALIDNEI